MSLTEIILIGIALSMDAFSVCIASGVVYRNLSAAKKISMPLTFALFQGIMPVLGFFFGYMFEEIIMKLQGVIALVLLGFVGFNMIKEAIFDKDEETVKSFNLPQLMLLAVSTSIDAFAVGISFVAMNVSRGFQRPLSNIFIVSLIIALTTLVCCFIAIFLGEKIGNKFGRKAELFGGILLVLIGIKSMFF